jgi:predicted DNA-binding helix-hairpin-helix protein
LKFWPTRQYDMACTSCGVDRGGRKGSIGNSTALRLLPTALRRRTVHISIKGAYERMSARTTARIASTALERYCQGGLHASGACGADLQFYRRNYIEGLFVSSAVIRDPDYTTGAAHRKRCRYSGESIISGAMCTPRPYTGAGRKAPGKAGDAGRQAERKYRAALRKKP